MRLEAVHNVLVLLSKQSQLTIERAALLRIVSLLDESLSTGSSSEITHCAKTAKQLGALLGLDAAQEKVLRDSIEVERELARFDFVVDLHKQAQRRK